MLRILDIFALVRLISFIKKSTAGGCSGYLFCMINYNCTIESFWLESRHASVRF